MEVVRNLVSHNKREQGLAIFKNRVKTKVRVSMEEIRVDRSKTGNVRVTMRHIHITMLPWKSINL
jgi:hypothetical protein